MATDVGVDLEPETEGGDDIGILVGRKNLVDPLGIELLTDRGKDNGKDLQPARIRQDGVIPLDDQIFIGIDDKGRTLGITGNHCPLVITIRIQIPVIFSNPASTPDVSAILPVRNPVVKGDHPVCIQNRKPTKSCPFHVLIPR